VAVKRDLNAKSLAAFKEAVDMAAKVNSEDKQTTTRVSAILQTSPSIHSMIRGSFC
jgi:hypothetical protein